MRDKRFTQIVIRAEDKPKFDDLQKRLVMLRSGASINHPDFMLWLIKAGHKYIDSFQSGVAPDRLLLGFEDLINGNHNHDKETHNV